jgi:probable DNA metabolism protein
MLCAIFEIYDQKLGVAKLVKGSKAESMLFEEVIEIVTEEKRAARVLKGLRGRLSAIGIHRLYAAHLAGMDGGESSLLGYIRHVFNTPYNVEEDYGNKYVMRVSEMLQKVRREKHRMEAFVRFQKLSDGTFYAVIEPDYNVLPLLIKHFKHRYADQKWMIYDLKRSYGLYYDLHDTCFVTLDFAVELKGDKVIVAYSDDEEVYQHLWKNYFKSVNIPARNNTKLHLKHVPVRYWKHLTEKI